MRGRVLVVDRSEQVRQKLAAQLIACGFEVRTLDRTTLAPARLADRDVDLLVIDADDPTLTGREALAAAQRIHGARVPTVFLSTEGTHSALVRAIRGGALELIAKPPSANAGEQIARAWEEARGPLARLSAGPANDPLECASELLVSALKRRGQRFRLVVNPQTPFEGSVVFSDGEIERAQFLGRGGHEAVKEMLSIEDATWRSYDEPASRPSTDFVRGEDPDRVLLVDDEPEILRLLSMRLRAVGFDVITAQDGREALALAKKREVDAVVTDLNMPRLDGWGLLRELMADPTTREVPVLVLSADEILQGALRAASAGARAWLAKPVDTSELAQRIVQMLAPRWAAHAALVRGGTLKLEVGVIGPRWLLRVIGERRLTGQLAVADEFGAYEVAVQDGRPVLARAQVQGRSLHGSQALRALLGSRGADGTFTPLEVRDPPEFAVDMEALVGAVCAAVNIDNADALSRFIDRESAFDVDGELYSAYLRVSAASALPIARAYCGQRQPPRAIAEQLSVPLEVVEGVVRDLVRRGVVLPRTRGAGLRPLR